MLGASYKTKKQLKEAVGQPLRYVETSMFGAEYKPDGSFCVVGPSPYERKWFATVVIERWEDCEGIVKSDREKQREQVTIQMLNNPDSWPCWPVLPVKEHTFDASKQSFPRLAYVLDGSTIPGFTLYEGNMYNPQPETDPVLLSVKTAEEVVANGWWVD